VGSNPLVGVGLPVFNGEEFLAAAIDSVLAQTFQDFEIVISDNASTDGTEGICREYASRDARVTYHRASENHGIAWNFNQVFKLSSNEQFMWFSHDDILAPSYLERCVEVLRKDSSVVLCFSNWSEIDATGKLLGSYKSRVTMDSERRVERFRAAIRLDHLCEPWCGVARSEMIRKTGLYGSFADYDRVMFAELGLHGRFVEIPETLFFRREHKGRSVYLHPTRFERTSWIDPQRGDAVVFPHFREFREFWAAVGRARLVWREKIACQWALLGWAKTNRRRMASDLRFGVAELLRRLVSGNQVLAWAVKKLRIR
jgi:glycosyltransferase involved in cell wall biosynthesis